MFTYSHTLLQKIVRRSAVILPLLAVLLMWSHTVMPQPSVTTRTEVYQPLHRSAEDLRQSLAPLYKATATFSTNGNHLLINSDEKTLTSIHAVLERIDSPIRHFLVTLSEQPGADNTTTIGTRSRSFNHDAFELSEGNPIRLARKTQSQTVSSLSPWWTRMSTQDTQEDSLELMVTAVKDALTLHVKRRTLQNGQSVSVDKSIAVKPGEWFSLLSGRNVNDSTTKVISTRSRQNPELYIRVIER